MPRAGANDVLVRVEAAGVNRPDIMQRLGKYPPPPGASDLLGLELAGTVERVGASVTRWRSGDRICALVAGGGYAEYCVVPEPQACRFPPASIASTPRLLPETFFTVWTNLFQRARLRGRRARPDPRRHQRHRHDRDPAGARVRRQRDRHRRISREVRGLRKPRRDGDQLPHHRLRRGGPRTDPRAAASTSSSTSSAASYLPRNLECLAKDGTARARSACRAEQGPRSTLPR